MYTRLSLVAVLVLAAWFSVRADDKKPAAEGAKFFEKEVQPILQAQCARCHGAEPKVKGGLNLTTREGLLKGGDTGPAVVFEKPDESLLLQAVNHRDLKMPPKGKLAQAQIDILTRWVKMGAPYGAAAAKAHHGPPKVDDAARAFWAFRPLARPAVPAVKHAAWVKTPIDAFILAKLEAAGLRPAPPAEQRALIRRLYFDVLGMPPTPEQMAAAQAMPYEALVDQLLASHHYGEQWARHWLDLVRYAETNSFERDGPKPYIWRYRDYVIRSFNADKPYGQFLREQLAGDELDQVTPESMIATGYYRLGQWDDEPVDPVTALYDDLDDIVSTTGQVMLGLTVGCARCHDHKIDPFPQKDYYSFLAFFHGVQRFGVRSADSVAKASLTTLVLPEEQLAQKAVLAAHERQGAELDKQIRELEEAVAPKLAGGEIDDFKFEQNRPGILKKHVGTLLDENLFAKYQGLRRQREKLEKARPGGGSQAMVVKEVGKTARETFVLARGNPQAKGEKVEPAFPTVLTSAVPRVPRPGEQTSGRRRVVAEWITDPANPLPWRVIANRIWQYHFGRGIVRSSNNFGYMGTPPTHPELLDWLAAEFLERGGTMKPLHKLILMSNAYQMSAQADAAALAKDPENDLLWRFSMRRLAAEELRDAILSVSGNLNLAKTNGPSVYPIIPPEVLAGQSQPGLGWGKSSPEERASRSVFVFVKRSLVVPMLAAFDAADTDASCPVRFTTTQPSQALTLLNSTFINDQAKVFADSVRKQSGDDPAAQVRTVLGRVTQRPPTDVEVARGVQFLGELRTSDQLPAEEALRRFCLLALNLNEFVYLD